MEFGRSTLQGDGALCEVALPGARRLASLVRRGYLSAQIE